MLIPNQQNKKIQALTRAKAKMFEFGVPLEQHINTEGFILSDMLDLTIGILGDLTASKLDNLESEKYRLLFSAQYFNAIIEANYISNNNTLLNLLSSSAYFLSGYPGSSQVLLKSIGQEKINELDQMEQVLFAVLKRMPFDKKLIDSYFNEELKGLVDSWNSFLNNEADFESLDLSTKTLRSSVYQYGSDKELLLVDVIRALILNRYHVSLFSVLSKYSDIDINLWKSYLSKPGSINEFWPSQIKLAKFGVFKGLSAIIQMPTSAGKTKATEFIIRSAFVGNRATLAVIVAPFRSLCQEIYNDFNKSFNENSDVNINLVSDVLQEDFEISQESSKSVLILTPEKLDFLLRHNSNLSRAIGLIIYDEGHLFDDSARGTKYELLLSSLKQQLPKNAQVVLISAVIKNAEQVKEWLLDKDSALVDGKDLSPTNRNIAFVEWSLRFRTLQFVDENDINEGLFYVPTVLKSYEINNRKNESPKFYPKPTKGEFDSSQIAGLLGIRLSESGLSAIFVGQKLSAQRISKDLIDAFDRNLPLSKPIIFSENITQANKIISYIERILGPESINAKASKIGLLMHHAGIPHGLRLVTEDALQKSYFKLIVCTSTLAQGVNLPIRYLIISTSHQAGEKMKTRDFYNLMGRAGRSGKYTEGTVIFSNPKIYNSYPRKGKHWTEIEHLLDKRNSEPSQSRLQLLLEDKPQDADEQVVWNNNIVEIKNEIASYLLNALSGTEDLREIEQIITNLVQNTLGYAQLRTEEQKTILTNIFLDIGLNIIIEIPNADQRLIYSRSILSIEQSKSFVASIKDNVEDIAESLRIDDPMIVLDLFWDYLYTHSRVNSMVKNFWWCYLMSDTL